MRKYAYKCVILIGLLLLTGCNVISALTAPEEVEESPLVFIDIEAENARLLQQIEFEAQRIELFRATQELDFLRRDYELLTQHSDRLQDIVTSLETQEAVIAGYFTATVRHLMPNYVTDNQLRMAVLTEIGGNPFVLEMNPEIIQNLTVGENYSFQLDATPVGEVLTSSIWRSTSIDNFHATVVNVRPAAPQEHQSSTWLLPPDYQLTDNEIHDMYQRAREIFSWFDSNSYHERTGEIITLEGEAANAVLPGGWHFNPGEFWTGQRITDFNTMAELVEEMHNFFSPGKVDYILHVWGQNLAEIDGVLYSTIEEPNQIDGTLRTRDYEIIRHSSFTVIYQQTIRRYEFSDDEQPPTSIYEVHDFYLVFDPATRVWRFHNFEIN